VHTGHIVLILEGTSAYREGRHFDLSDYLGQFSSDVRVTVYMINTQVGDTLQHLELWEEQVRVIMVVVTVSARHAKQSEGMQETAPWY